MRARACLSISRALFSAHFGRCPGAQALNAATVSLPGYQAGLTLCSVVANGLKSAHNRLRAPSPPVLTRPHPSTSLSCCMGTRAPGWTRARSALWWHVPSSLAPIRPFFCRMAGNTPPPPPNSAPSGSYSSVSNPLTCLEMEISRLLRSCEVI